MTVSPLAELPPIVRQPTKYPWNDLAVGESFFVEQPPEYFQNMVYLAGRMRQKKFSMRTIDGGVRVWRVA